MALTDDDKAVLVLTTRLGNRTRPSLGPAAWSELSQVLADNSVRACVLLTETCSFLSKAQRSRVSQLVADTEAVMTAVEDLQAMGIWVCPITSDSYPGTLVGRLARKAPPVLFGVGERSMLDGGGIGVVGSRDVPRGGAAIAIDVAREAVRSGRQVVSGAARGVDQLAMNAAYEAGGSVLGVLADSLLEKIRSPQVLAALDEGNTCLVTQQHPSTGFSAAGAMARNKLIYAIADLTVVVASDLETGGTWAGATQALKAGYGRVAVYRGAGEGPGNLGLEKLGATTLSGVDQLPSLLAEDPMERPAQLRLVD